MIALIPARAGSRRIPGKNTKELAGLPLMEWTIRTAIESGVFAEIMICSDDQTVIVQAACAGLRLMTRDPVSDDQPDIEWVRGALSKSVCEAFAILRPTSPFRTAETIRRAHQQFRKSEVHSLRAVERCKYHPGKMWWNNGPGYPMTPVCDAHRSDGTPWHSSPTQSLPPVYVQNSSLEMAWSYVVKSFGTIAGKKIAPFVTEGYEGFSLDYPDDWAEAERLLREGLIELPRLPVAAEAPPAPTL